VEVPGIAIYVPIVFLMLVVTVFDPGVWSRVWELIRTAGNLLGPF
jgi:hypothetical protein